MTYTRTIVFALLLTGLVVSQAMAQTSASGQAKSADQTQAYADLMRKNLRMEKQSIVDQAMELEAGDKAKFWAVYDKYQKELNGIWDQRMANIKKYAENYTNMTDAVADQLATTALSIEDQNRALRRKYYAQFKTALNARVAARFLQVESALGHLIDLQLAAQIPLVK
ncbi:MAG: hypothetical protein U0V70_03745 [Terriglobia bacterium]